MGRGGEGRGGGRDGFVVFLRAGIFLRSGFYFGEQHHFREALFGWFFPNS